MIIYRDDDEADLRLLSPAGRRALSNGNGHVEHHDEHDLHDEILTLQHKVAKLERKRVPQGMTRSDAEDLVQALANVINELSARIETLEKRPELKWIGTWREGLEVEANSLLTDRGSLWLATEAAKGARPGESPVFRLVVKNGFHSEDRKHRSATATRSAPSLGR